LRAGFTVTTYPSGTSGKVFRGISGYVNRRGPWREIRSARVKKSVRSRQSMLINVWWPRQSRPLSSVGCS
jgi:hypothetical protein